MMPRFLYTGGALLQYVRICRKGVPRMKCPRTFIQILAASLLVAAVLITQSESCAEGATSPTVSESCPGLSNGALSFATLGELPDGVLLRSDKTEITSASLDEEIEAAPETAREDLRNNRFFMLEQVATEKLFLELARQQAAAAQKEIASTPEQDILNDYVQGIVGAIDATEEEVAAFYEANKDMCGGAAFDQMKDELKKYVIQQKQQDAFEEHIRTLGQRVPIIVAAAWTREQATAAKDNPVDKARDSGKPTMVDFGASGCRPCDMMTPILAELTKKYEGKANILFVHVREAQVLATRYGIRSIPVQVFFDKDGKEVYRHTGFFPQAEIEKRLAELGAQ